MNLFYLWVVSKTLLCGCNPDVRRHDFDKGRSKYTIDKIAVMPRLVTESSGLARAHDNRSFWTHNDSGSPSELFRIGLGGELLEHRPFPDILNRDWEDLAQDPSGRLFIGDFGNNSNARKDLTIHILPEGWENTGKPVKSEKITFRYGQQQHFPEDKKHRNYDCEAFFFQNDSLYLFSKNTGRRPRYTLMYKLPARAGDYTLYPVDSIRLNETITGADIRPDGRQYVLLSYGKVFFFDVTGGVVDFSQPAFCLKKYRGQTEAVLYQKDGSLLITNEKGEVLEVRSK